MKYICTYVAIITPDAQLYKSIFEQSEQVTWVLIISGICFFTQCPCSEIVTPIYVRKGLFTGI